MRLMRAVLTVSSAIAIAAIVLVPAARADEYNKLTYLTFSAPIQVPGVSLPAGTYMFKLADPESGRRAIQIWSQDGSKLYTTLLTIPEQMAEPKDEPVVIFMESPSGAPHAIRSWFYPGDRTGQEFIYPKDQALKIATATNTEVLAYTGELKTDSDVTAMRGSAVGRVGASGQASATNTASADTAQSSTSTATATTATATTTAEPAAQAAASQPSAAPAATVDQTPTTAGAAASATTTAPSTTARTETAPAASATAGRSDLSIDQNVPPQRAVGTSGQVAENRSGQAGEGRQLPATASPLLALELLSASTFAAALALRRLRRRVMETQ